MIINEDCRVFLEEHRNSGEIADIVITSPPYNMNLRVRNGKYCSRQIVKELSTKYKDYDDNLPMDDYEAFITKVAKGCMDMAPLVFWNIQVLTGNKPAVFKMLGALAEYVKEIIVWDKKNAQPAIGTGVLNSQFELIIVFSKHDAMTRSFAEANFSRGTLSNIWKIKRGKKQHKEHGAVFPEELIERIIENFTETGDTVFDPFTGTGTTGVVAKKLGRKFIGTEVSKDYCDFANERVYGKLDFLL